MSPAKKTKLSDKQLHLILDSIDDALVVTDLSLIAIEVNKSALRLFGARNRSEVIGRSLLDFIAEGDRDRASRLLKNTGQKARPGDGGTFTLADAEGRRINIELHPSVLRGDDGQPAGCVWVAHDTAERKRMEEAVQESEDKLRAFIENARDAIFIYDLLGTFIDCNRKAEELTGYPKEQLIGKNFFSAGLLPQGYALDTLIGADERITGEPARFDELQMVTRDGRWVVIEITSFPVTREGKMEVLGIARDVTERRQAEEQIARHTRYLEALHAVAQTTSHTLETQELLDSSLSKVLEVMRMEAGGIFLLDAPSMQLTLRSHINVSDELVRDIGSIQMTPDELGRALKLDEPAIRLEAVFDKPNYEAVMQALENDGLKMLTIVPLTAKAKIAGVLCLSSRTPRHLADADVDLLRAMGGQIAVAIENASLYQETKDKAGRLAIIAELNRVIGSSLDINDIYETFTSGLKRLIDFDRATIAIIEEGNIRFIAVSTSIDTELVADMAIPLAGTATEWVARNKRVNVEHDLEKEHQFAIDEVHIREGMRSAIRFPLISKGEVFGTFNLSSRHPHAFGKREHEILEELAGQISVAIENHRLFTEVKRRRDELELAYRQLAEKASALAQTKHAGQA